MLFSEATWKDLTKKNGAELIKEKLHIRLKKIVYPDKVIAIHFYELLGA
jgi:hypothetical protein